MNSTNSFRIISDPFAEQNHSDDGHEQEHGDDLERQQVLAEEQFAQRAVAPSPPGFSPWPMREVQMVLPVKAAGRRQKPRRRLRRDLELAAHLCFEVKQHDHEQEEHHDRAA